MSPQTFIFAGGGTGGHLYPGLAIAEQLTAQIGEHARCIFLCSSREIDSRILDAAGVEFVALPAQPVSTRPLRLLRFLRGWAPSVRLTRKLIAGARSEGPVQLVAMGGFVAAPCVQAARVERTPITLVNLDAVPGKANRLIAKRAGACFTAAPVADPIAQTWTVVPPIVRASARSDGTQAEARIKLGLDPEKPTLMITGGSQGAGSVNAFVAAFVQHHAPELAGWQVLHQTGRAKERDDAQFVRGAYQQAGIPARVEEFVDVMGLWWRAADLAISRCGAGSVAEAWASQTPCLLLPYPYHKDQHQKINAQVLVNADGAVVADDQIDPVQNRLSIGPILSDLLKRPDKRAVMRQAITGLGPVDGAQRVAQALISGLSGAQNR